VAPNSSNLNPLDYEVWGMLESYHKLQLKPKTVPEFKNALQLIGLPYWRKVLTTP